MVISTPTLAILIVPRLGGLRAVQREEGSSCLSISERRRLGGPDLPTRHFWRVDRRPLVVRVDGATGEDRGRKCARERGYETICPGGWGRHER